MNSITDNKINITLNNQYYDGNDVEEYKNIIIQKTKKLQLNAWLENIIPILLFSGIMICIDRLVKTRNIPYLVPYLDLILLFIAIVNLVYMFRCGNMIYDLITLKNKSLMGKFIYFVKDKKEECNIPLSIMLLANKFKLNNISFVGNNLKSSSPTDSFYLNITDENNKAMAFEIYTKDVCFIAGNEININLNTGSLQIGEDYNDIEVINNEDESMHDM